MKVIFYNSQFVVSTSCEISYDINCVCSKVIWNMVLVFLSQSSRLLIKFVIVTYAMCFKRMWMVLVWRYGPVIGEPIRLHPFWC